MTQMKKRLAWVAATIFLACPARAAPPSGPGYTMPSTHMWEMSSDSGAVYRIFVSFPGEGKPPAGGYPVLYVLDGNAMFASFAETRRILEYDEGGQAIVVGVGYPTDKAYDERRLNDFTGGPPPPPWKEEFAQLASGGWDEFLDFLTGKLRVEIGGRYPVNAERQALFGHSLGGLFAIHALFSRPDAFHAIVAASPTLFWHEREMLAEEREFVARLQAGQIPKASRLLVVAGELEETPLERWDGEAFARRMEPLSAWGLRVRSAIYAGEGHVTVPSRAVTDTLRFALSWP